MWRSSRTCPHAAVRAARIRRLAQVLAGQRSLLGRSSAQRERQRRLASLRVDYRNRLVDALVVALTRLVAAGEAQEGLLVRPWRSSATARAKTPHLPLWHGQLAAGSVRPLETYFACRRFLPTSWHRPSSKRCASYRSIIETETDFGVTDGERNNEHRLRKRYIWI